MRDRLSGFPTEARAVCAGQSLGGGGGGGGVEKYEFLAIKNSCALTYKMPVELLDTNDLNYSLSFVANCKNN